MFTGLWPAAGFIPPLLPSADAETIAAIFRESATRIQIGAILILIAGGLFAPFAGAVAAQMRRMEYRATPVLTYTALACGVATVLLFVIPALSWTIAAYRAERSPEIVQLLNDIGWFFFVMPNVIGIVLNAALGFAILGDKGDEPVFPRWVGYFNLWIALLIAPGLLITFFKTGPFAWNGLLAFWLPAATAGPWQFIISIYLIKAARRQAIEVAVSPRGVR